METSPLPVKGSKIWAYARRSRPLRREVSLSCHTYCDTGPRFFRSHPKDRPIQSPPKTHGLYWQEFFSGLNSPKHRGKFTFRGPCFHLLISLTTNFQKCLLSFLEVHISKILKSVTLPATYRCLACLNTPEHLISWKQKLTRNEETTHFQNLVFPGTKFPSIMAGTCTSLEHKS
jgi:hypothetical protein